jgi:hypothetical protein
VLGAQQNVSLAGVIRLSRLEPEYSSAAGWLNASCVRLQAGQSLRVCVPHGSERFVGLVDLSLNQVSGDRIREITTAGRRFTCGGISGSLTPAVSSFGRRSAGSWG